MPNKKILINKKDHITVITINRPEVRNALDKESMLLLAEAFHQFNNDPSSPVAVLHGAGGSFCAGADLKELAAGDIYEPWAGVEGLLAKPSKKPVIAAIAGHACAGGLGVALWCDLRVVEKNAQFAILSRRWGVPMSDGTTVRLPRLIGMSHALDMLLTAKTVHGAEAKEIGLANRLVDEGQALQEAEKLAAHIAQFPQMAMLSDRQSTYEQAGLPLAIALSWENQLSIPPRLQSASEGAQQFAKGEGRHGRLTS